MNRVSRVVRYARAFLGLGRLSRATATLADQPLQLVQRVFDFCSGFLEPIQVEEEIASLVEEVRRLRPRHVLEIGTSMGGTLYLWTRVTQADATIVSVDLPGGKFGGGYSRLRAPLYRRFARDRQTVFLMRADSHAPATAARVRCLFDDQTVDFLFIDGDHTYEGVRQDWEQYGPLVRPGGLVAFHDIARNYEDTQVKRFWDEIKGQFECREYAFHPHGFYGIGLLRK